MMAHRRFLAASFCLALLCGLPFATPAHAGEVITWPGNGVLANLTMQIRTFANSLAPSATSPSGNSVTVSGGSIGSPGTDGFVFGGYSTGSDDVTNNTVTVSGGSIGSNVYGGFTSGNATGNSVVISGGSIGGDVYGSFAGNNATGNSVVISGGSFGGDVIGGGNTMGDATGNTVSLSGSPTLTNTGIFGGSSDNGTGDVRTGNTLEVRSLGLSARKVGNFQHFRFYLPASVKANDVMLSLSAEVDISTPAGKAATTVGVGIMGAGGGSATLAVGDAVTLIKSVAGLTADAGMKNTLTGMQGISTVYEFDLLTTTTELQAKVSKISKSDEAIRKSPAEGKAASVSLVTQGADLISGQGMGNAREATKAASGAAGTGASGASGMGVAGFGAMNGGASTYKTGSHVDVKGVSFMAGLAKRLPLSGVDALAGAFFETGFGSYDSYNDGPNGSDIKGWGNSRYFGGGLMGRLEWTEGAVNGLYTEASARAGGLSSDYKSDDLNPALGRADYNTSSTYYGLHAGLGYIWQLTENASLDLYGKYFWTHTTGSNVRILGDKVEFDAVNSHRTRLGARFSYAVNENFAPYAGAAWEYEFDGDAHSTVAGQSVAAPSLKGSTGLGELGISWKPSAASGFSVDLGAQGYVGMREGVSGSLQLKFEF